MTDEEKKEFEEFLQWKADKKKKEEKEKAKASDAPSNSSDVYVHNESKELKPSYVETTNKSGASGIAIMIGVIMVIIVIGLIVAKGCKPSSETYAMADSTATDSAFVDTTAVSPTADNSSWNYKTDTDEMRGSKEYRATLTSDYDENAGVIGGGDMTIYVRNSKRFGGLDVFLYLSGDQFGGSEYSGTNYVTVKFDNGPLRKYYYTEGSGSGTDAAFINKKTDFLAQLKKAKSIKIEARLFSAGTKQFNFSTSKPLEWNH